MASWLGSLLCLVPKEGPSRPHHCLPGEWKVHRSLSILNWSSHDTQVHQWVLSHLPSYCFSTVGFPCLPHPCCRQRVSDMAVLTRLPWTTQVHSLGKQFIRKQHGALFFFPSLSLFYTSTCLLSFLRARETRHLGSRLGSAAVYDFEQHLARRSFCFSLCKVTMVLSPVPPQLAARTQQNIHTLILKKQNAVQILLLEPALPF
jgi:hypothetical protein